MLSDTAEPRLRSCDARTYLLVVSVGYGSTSYRRTKHPKQEIFQNLPRARHGTACLQLISPGPVILPRPSAILASSQHE